MQQKLLSMTICLFWVHIHDPGSSQTQPASIQRHRCTIMSPGKVSPTFPNDILTQSVSVSIAPNLQSLSLFWGALGFFECPAGFSCRCMFEGTLLRLARRETKKKAAILEVPPPRLTQTRLPAKELVPHSCSAGGCILTARSRENCPSFWSLDMAHSRG